MEKIGKKNARATVQTSSGKIDQLLDETLVEKIISQNFKISIQQKHPLDTQYFDRAFTRERVRLTPIDKEILQSMDQQQFQGFTYTNPNATPT